MINCTPTCSEVKAMFTIEIKSLDSAFNDLTFLMPQYARFSKHLHSCLVTLATSSVWIVLFRINQNSKATQAEAHHNPFSSEHRFAHRQMTACISSRRRRRCSCAVKRSGNWGSTAKANSPHTCDPVCSHQDLWDGGNWISCNIILMF